MLIDLFNSDGEGLIKSIMGHHPAVTEIINEIQETERIVIENRIRTTKKQEVQEKHLIVIPFNSEQDLMNTEEMYDKFRQFRGILDDHPKNEVTLVVDRGINRLYTRKLLKYALRNIEIKINIATPISEIEPKPGTKTEKIIIKTGTSTYADLLKNIKTSVDIDRVGAGIRNIKKTQMGYIIMEVEGGKADTLRNEFRRTVNDINDKDITIQKKGKHYR